MRLLRRKAAAAENRAPPARPPFDDLGNFIIVVLDSCRYTPSWSGPPVVTRLGSPEARYSYASWTAPSHYNLLMGLMPHTSPAGVFAKRVLQKDFIRFNQRLGASGIEFKSLVPGLYLPDFLRDTLGYRNPRHGVTAGLNSFTPLNPRVRHLPAHGEAQRHEGHAGPDDFFRRTGPVSTC